MESPRCKSRSRQTGEPCKLPPVPFGEFCRFHGGNRVQHREKARKAMLDFEQWDPAPWYIKRERIREWRRSQRRWEDRRAKKAGPEAVAHLAAERAAEAAEKAAWEEANRQARRASRDAYNHEKARNGQQYDDQPGYGTAAYDQIDWL